MRARKVPGGPLVFGGSTPGQVYQDEVAVRVRDILLVYKDLLIVSSGHGEELSRKGKEAGEGVLCPPGFACALYFGCGLA